MRVAIVAMDTRGGVQPYLALGRGLAAAGHGVRLVAPGGFGAMVRSAAPALEHAPLSADIEAFVRSSAGATEGSGRAIAASARAFAQGLAGWTREALEGCEGVDVVTGGVGGMVLGLAVAERLGVPFVPTHLQPLGAPTERYPGPLVAGVPRWLGGLGVRASHYASAAALWGPFVPAMLAVRRKLGLELAPPGPGRGPAAAMPTLYGFSRHVVPVPPHPTRERVVTGYWCADTPAGASLAPALEAFLARPDARPVVSVGFGSMATKDPVALTRLVCGAARRAGVRVVLLAGWGALAREAALEEEGLAYVADEAPHELLFARVRGVVHHGGAGTTGAALRAGVPALVVPFAMDQPFWGARVFALGAGPRPVARRRLTEDALAAALAALAGDEAMATRAAALGRLLREEDGVGAAVARFDALARALRRG